MEQTKVTVSLALFESFVQLLHGPAAELRETEQLVRRHLTDEHENRGDGLWLLMSAFPAEWIRTSEEFAQEMLGCVPPRAGGYGRFLVGEPIHDCARTGRPIYASFCKEGDRWFARYQTLAEFQKGGAL